MNIEGGADKKLIKIALFLLYYRGTPFKNVAASKGWWLRFRKRHPTLALRTPSLLDPGRLAMSRTSVMDSFFENVQQFTQKYQITDPSRVYNIDESWFTPNVEKSRRVVVRQGSSMPYKVFDGSKDHITMALCICANGTWVPPLFVFKGRLPAGDAFHETGPENALYANTESGHVDSDTYFLYIKHIERFLNPIRPVVIYQDNLSCHDNLALIEFCVSKQIHLFNFPPKTTHLVQPLDKLFNPFKTEFEKQKQKAALVQQHHLSNEKVTTLTRFTMRSTSPEFIKKVFRITGIYPVNRNAIRNDLLVGDSPRVPLVQASEGSGNTVGDLQMEVEAFDMDNNPIQSQLEIQRANGMEEIAVQTDPIMSLPCSECITNEVALHPAVSSGIVDLELATVFIQDSHTAAISNNATRRKRRNGVHGRCLTTEDEVERRRKIRDEEDAKAEKERRLAEKQAKIDEKKKQEELKKANQEKAKKYKLELQQFEKEAQKGMVKRRKCCTCGSVIQPENMASCLLCQSKYHRQCVDETSGFMICVLCQFKNDRRT